MLMQVRGYGFSAILVIHGASILAIFVINKTGLLTGCAGAGPHNSIKAAQSRTIYENPGNPAQYGKI